MYQIRGQKVCRPRADGPHSAGVAAGGVSEDNRPIHLPGAFEQESIFDVFVRENIKYEYLMYPVVDGKDDSVVEALIQHRNSDAKVIMGMFSDSDAAVHNCGPSSPQRRRITGEIDRKLQKISANYSDETTWIVIGDHGMTDVVDEIDVPAAIESLESRMNVRMGRDYLLFLDSTMARFRRITEDGEKFLDEVKNVPLLREKGRFIDQQTAEEYSIPIDDRRYGDLIWWANPGILLFPDYFHNLRTHNKGMHGYDSNHDDMKGFFLAWGAEIEPRKLDQINLIDVCPTLCDLVAVPHPKNNKGASIIGCE